MDKLQEAVLLAAKIREESWSKEKESYEKSIYDSADKASECVGFDTRGTELICIMLRSAWNESLDWANNVNHPRDLNKNNLEKSVKVKLKNLDEIELREIIAKELSEGNIGNSMADFFYILSMLTSEIEIIGCLTPCSDYLIPDGNDCFIPFNILEKIA